MRDLCAGMSRNRGNAQQPLLTLIPPSSTTPQPHVALRPSQDQSESQYAKHNASCTSARTMRKLPLQEPQTTPPVPELEPAGQTRRHLQPPRAQEIPHPHYPCDIELLTSTRQPERQ